MLKCKEITELASKGLDTSIPWLKRSEIKLHLLICKTCYQYVKQIAFIHNIFSEIDEHGENIVLSAEAKSRIQAKLNQLKT